MIKRSHFLYLDELIYFLALLQLCSKTFVEWDIQIPNPKSSTVLFVFHLEKNKLKNWNPKKNLMISIQ